MAALAQFHVGVMGVCAAADVGFAFFGNHVARFNGVAAADDAVFAVQIEQGDVIFGVVDGDGAVLVRAAGHFAAQNRVQRRALDVHKVNALVNAGVAPNALAILFALAVLAVVERGFAHVRAVETLAHGVGDIQHDGRDGQRAAFVGDEVFFRHGAVKRRQAVFAVVVGVHVIEIRDFALADVAVLADEIAVFGRDRQVMLRLSCRFGLNGGSRRFRRALRISARSQKQARQSERRDPSFFHGMPSDNSVFRATNGHVAIFLLSLYQKAMKTQAFFANFGLRTGWMGFGFFLFPLLCAIMKPNG